MSIRPRERKKSGRRRTSSFHEVEAHLVVEARPRCIVAVRRDAARNVLGCAFFRAVEHLHELDRVALAQGVAVHDGRHVAEEVLAAVGLRWGKNASSFGSRDRYVIRTRNLQDWNLTRYRCANRSKLHPVGFEPTPPKRLGLKSNALDQLGHGYKVNGTEDS